MDETEGRKPSGDKEAIIREARENLTRAVTAESHNRDDAIEALEFSNLEQWPENVKRSRLQDHRPCLTLDRTDPVVRGVVNNIRESRPAIKTRGIDEDSDPKTAEILNGMIRAIEQGCNAESAYDWGAEYAIRMGWGYWKVDTEYEHEESFRQHVVVRRVQNPLTVYLDPDHEEPDGSDARWAIETWWEEEELAKENWGDEVTLNAGQWSDGRGVGDEKWYDKNKVRLAKYWKVKNERVTLYLMPDGSVTSDADAEYQMEEEGPLEGMYVPKGGIVSAKEAAVKTREASLQRVVWYIINGDTVLREGDWAGKYIPIVLCVGEELDVEGKRYRRGVIKRLMDPQRQYNYWRSAHTERVALAPQAPWVGPEGAFKNSKWSRANRRNYAYLEWDVEAVNHAGGAGVARPTREHGAQISPGDVHEQQVAADDIRAVSGQHQPGLNEGVDNSSGRAVWQTRNAADQSNFHFLDNVARSMRHTGRILVDLIPKIYDTERVVRIIGEDGEEDSVRVNPESPNPNAQEKQVDLNTGRYDVAVDVGPSYATQRQEAQAFILEIISSVEGAGPLVADLLAKNSDAAGSEQIAERLKALVPPEVMAGENPQVAAAIKGLQGQLQAMGQQYQQLAEEYKKLELENKNKAGEIAVKMAELRQKGEQELRELRQKAQQEQDELFLRAVELELEFRTDIAGQGLEAEKIRSQAQSKE